LLGLGIRGVGRSCLGMRTVKRVEAEDGVGTGVGIVMTQSNSYREKEKNENCVCVCVCVCVCEREREREGVEISDEKLLMITETPARKPR